MNTGNLLIKLSLRHLPNVTVAFTYPISFNSDQDDAFVVSPPKRESTAPFIREGIPSSVASAPSCPVSLPSDLSFLDEDLDTSLRNNEFCAMVTPQQEAASAERQGTNVFRWKAIVAPLAEKKKKILLCFSQQGSNRIKV